MVAEHLVFCPEGYGIYELGKSESGKPFSCSMSGSCQQSCSVLVFFVSIPGGNFDNTNQHQNKSKDCRTIIKRSLEKDVIERRHRFPFFAKIVFAILAAFFTFFRRAHSNADSLWENTPLLP